MYGDSSNMAYANGYNRPPNQPRRPPNQNMGAQRIPGDAFGYNNQ